MKNATYVESARLGKYRGWRYPLGLVVILVSWLVVGTVASVLVALALSVQTDYYVLGPFGKFLFVMVGFPFFLAGVLIAVSLIQRRYPGRWLRRGSGSTGVASVRGLWRGPFQRV